MTTETDNAYALVVEAIASVPRPDGLPTGVGDAGQLVDIALRGRTETKAAEKLRNWRRLAERYLESRSPADARLLLDAVRMAEAGL